MRVFISTVLFFRVSRCTSFHCAPLLRCTSECRTLALMQCMPKATQHLPSLPTSLSPTDFIT